MAQDSIEIPKPISGKIDIHNLLEIILPKW